MKKVVSITFAILILLSGMHLSIAKHICSGEITDVSVSFSAKKAGCGMDENKPDGLNKKCCQNEFNFFSVDNNYAPSFFKIPVQEDHVLNLLAIFQPIDNTTQYTALFSTNASPPDLKIASNVNLASICVFRI